MRYLGLAVDFDGTLATDGCVDDATVEALLRVRASGRRLVMATGRELQDLHATFARVDLFDIIVAENGGVMYRPSAATQVALAPAPLPVFLDALRAHGVAVSVGAVIVATWEPYAAAVYAAIRDLGLDLDVILNKGAVMVLPSGVNKGTGLVRAAAELSLPLSAIVGVGDAENDRTLLRACGVGVAVANALPSLKEQADIVTRGARGEGVAEIVDRLIADDLAGIIPRPREEIGVVAHETDARKRGPHSSEPDA
jgi:hydroxymethylpyrimidine pyrophosphatase-like HAD family hydrolase